MTWCTQVLYSAIGGIQPLPAPSVHRGPVSGEPKPLSAAPHHTSFQGGIGVNMDSVTGGLQPVPAPQECRRSLPLAIWSLFLLLTSILFLRKSVTSSGVLPSPFLHLKCPSTPHLLPLAKRARDITHLYTPLQPLYEDGRGVQQDAILVEDSFLLCLRGSLAFTLEPTC